MNPHRYLQLCFIAFLFVSTAFGDVQQPFPEWRSKVDRSLLTENAKSYFSDQALKDFAESLGQLGKPQEFIQTLKRDRGGMTLRTYKVRFAKKAVQVWVRHMPDGKIEQYQIFSADE